MHNTKINDPRRHGKTEALMTKITAD